MRDYLIFIFIITLITAILISITLSNSKQDVKWFFVIWSIPVICILLIICSFIFMKTEVKTKQYPLVKYDGTYLHQDKSYKQWEVAADTGGIESELFYVDKYNLKVLNINKPVLSEQTTWDTMFGISIPNTDYWVLLPQNK